MHFSNMIVTGISCALVVAPAVAQQESIRGEAAAVAAAEEVLEIAGGREKWSQTTLVTEQNLYLRSGETGRLLIWRDLAGGVRRFEEIMPARHVIEILSPQGGWRSVNGAVQPMSAHELAVGRQGLRQEPYTLYHRIARRDPALRVELREQGRTLMVFDRDERVLSWFSLDDKQGVIGWGSHYNGNLNQHYYGPVVNVGDANLPKFGVASTGAFRFEYTKGNLSNTAVDMPAFAKR
jgi:hypothetical protein